MPPHAKMDQMVGQIEHSREHPPMPALSGREDVKKLFRLFAILCRTRARYLSCECMLAVQIRASALE